MGGEAVFGDPGDVWDFDAILSLQCRFSQDIASGEQALEEKSNVAFVAAVPIGCRTHNDLLKTIGFDLVREVLEPGVFAEGFPLGFDGSHG